MRKVLGLLLVLVLLLSSGMELVMAQDRTVVIDEITKGIDVVIVLDASDSMELEGQSVFPADKQRYRIDAGKLMLNMTGVDNSRAAFVSFNNGVTAQSDTELIDISDPYKRALMTDKMELATKLGGNTDIGAGLERAVEILDNSKDTGNTKMILLLTDGEISINSIKNVPITGQQKKDEEKKSEEKMFRASERAVEMGYKIYAIQLVPKNSRNDFSLAVRLLEKVANPTGGKVYNLGNKSQDLPKLFGDIFAMQIGAKMQELPTTTEVVNKENLTTASFSIPNRSIYEANLIVPIDNINTPSIKLVDPNGNVVGERSVSVDTTETRRFRLYKIKSPVTPGKWTLSYVPKTTGQQSYININTLYNYNVQLHTDIADTTMDKLGSLRFTTRFYEGLKPSEDAFLYQKTDELGGKITASYQILDENGQPQISSKEMDTNSDSFSAELSLKEAGIQKSGKYTTVIEAKGAGLERKMSFDFVLENQVPKVVGNYEKSLSFGVDDPKLLEDKKIYELDLNSVFEEVEQEKLSYEIIVPEGSDLLEAKVEGNKLLVYTTGKTGVAKLDLIARDTERAEAQISVEFDAYYLKDEIEKKYSLELRTSASKESHLEADKNQDIEVELGFVNNTTGQYVDLDGFVTEVGLQVQEEKAGLSHKYPMTFDAEKKAYIYTLKSSDKAEEYSLQGRVQLGNQIVESRQNLSISVPNVAPLPNEEVNFPKLLSIEPLGFLPFLSQEDHSRTEIHLNQFFVDANNEVLTYIVNIEPNQEGLLSREGDVLTLNFPKVGSYKLDVKAVDNDGEEVQREFVFEVRSHKDIIFRQILLYGSIVLAALLVLYFIIWLLKPKFPKGVQIEWYEAGVKAMYKISASKRPFSIKALHSPLDGYDSKFASKLLVKPRSSSGVTLVVPENRSFELLLNDLQVHKGKHYWPIDTVLEIRKSAGAEDFASDDYIVRLHLNKSAEDMYTSF